MAERVLFETAEVYFGEWIVTMLYSPWKLFVYFTNEEYTNNKPEYILPYKNKIYARSWADNVATNGVILPYEY